VVDTYNIGDELEGTVTKVVTFGAFVEILDGVEGLVHISELAQHHVENPREIIQPGDPVRVKILEIDSERRRLSLSIKRVEGQVLPVRPIIPPAEGDAGDLSDVPELGLSEDVFAPAPEVYDEPAAPAETTADELVVDEPAADEPAALAEPVADEPAALAETMVDEPAALAEPVADEPVADEPTGLAETVADEPAASAEASDAGSANGVAPDAESADAADASAQSAG
jgi:small subunit ribosomal protein S1